MFLCVSQRYDRDLDDNIFISKLLNYFEYKNNRVDN